MQSATPGSLVSRAIGAAMLDVDVYEEVEADRTATSQAATVVLAVAVANVVGSWGSGSHGMFAGVAGAFIGFGVGIWTLIAGVIAIRQALDFGTGKAVATALLSMVAVILVSVAMGVVFGVTYGIGSAVLS